MSNNIEEFKGTIKYLFKGCPKPSGWFGCFFHIRGEVDDIRLTGTANFPVEDGVQLRVKAYEDTDKDQWVATEIEPIVSSRTTLVAYLSGHLFAGIGKKTANDLWDNFGDDALEVIKSNPDKLRAIGISDSKIQVLQLGVAAGSVENSLIQLIPTVNPEIIKQIVDIYGNDSIIKIKQDPYILYSEFGMRFDTVDLIAVRDIHITSNSILRLKWLTYFAAKEMCKDNGDMFINISDAVSWTKYINRVMSRANDPSIVTFGHVTQQEVNAVINNNYKLIVCDYNGDRIFRLYPRENYGAETKCAGLVSKFINDNANDRCVIKVSHKVINAMISNYEADMKCRLDADQKQAVINALTNKISIVTGGPGVGKTSTVDCILYCWDMLCNASGTSKTVRPPVLSAPTGRAVKRLKQQVHRRKGANYKDICTCARRAVPYMFKSFNQKLIDDSIKANAGRLCIIDEVSMLGMALAGQCLEIFRESQIVLVGDVDQLPSIDCGAFFSSVCNMDGIPKAVLKTCYRALSDGKTIIDNAKKINSGMHCKSWNYDIDHFMFYSHASDDDAFADDIVSKYIDHLSDVKNNSFEDICVVTPFNTSSVGAKMLNIKLQAALNKSNNASPTFDFKMIRDVYNIRGMDCPCTKYFGLNGQSTAFRIGDRVMYTENNTAIQTYDYEIDANTGFVNLVNNSGMGLFNGDCGTIIQCVVGKSDKNEVELYIALDDDRLCIITSSNFKHLQLAYAMTVHKVQGCEFPVVMFVAANRLHQLPPDFQFASRNLLYTAITRASNNVEILGSEESLNVCVDGILRERLSLFMNRVADTLAGIN